MTFEIWVHRDEGAAILTNPLDCLERRRIQSHDYYLHGRLEADDPDTAQDNFSAWCRTRLPDVTEQTVDGEQMERQWRRMMLECA
jgi:hypothetical protein